MINFKLQNNALIVETDSRYFFPFENGKISLPLNSITYTLPFKSDYITFRSASNNDVLFAADINEIMINGNAVSRLTFVNAFNAIAYSEASSAGIETDPIFTAWKDTAFWQGTQAEYDALATKNPNTTYYIIEE